jgi:hypothetical protein
MYNYTFWEYTNMHLILGEACGKGATTVRLYPERYLNVDFRIPACFTPLIITLGRLGLFALLQQTMEDEELHEQFMW